MYSDYPSCVDHLRRPSGIHGRQKEPQTATLATGQRELVKGLVSGTRVTTVTEVVGGCSFGSMVEAFGSAAT